MQQYHDADSSLSNPNLLFTEFFSILQFSEAEIWYFHRFGLELGVQTDTRKERSSGFKLDFFLW